jgi:hypothetical protein
MADNKHTAFSEIPGNDLSSCTDGLRLGIITGIDALGRVLVDYPGNVQGALPARLTSSAKEKLPRVTLVGCNVLLGFVNNDPGIPVIIDTLYSLLDEITEQSNQALEAQRPEEVTIDGRRVILDAAEEIVLRCGEASITLTSAGKVLIKGNYLISRSSGANRIKGASVQIN